MDRLKIIQQSPCALEYRANNPRTHSPKQIRQIADSIRRFGFRNPVLVDRHNRIIAGHGRVAAARQLGLELVPTIRLEDMTEDEIRAYVIADNKLAENAGWDRSLLALEFQHLIDVDLDFDVSVTLARRLDVSSHYLSQDALTLTGAFTLRRRGVEARLVLGDTSSGVDQTLLKNVAQGWAWFEEIKAGMTMQAIAEREGMKQRRIAHLVDLAFLAPDLVQAIVDGRQPVTLTADRLIRSKIPPLWADQRAWIAAI